MVGAPDVLEARCLSESLTIVSSARSVVPVATICIEAGGTLQAPIKPEGGGPVCGGGVGSGDEWPELAGGGVNVWHISNAKGEMWRFEVYSNASVEPSVVCTLQGCSKTDVPIVVPTIPRDEALIVKLGDLFFAIGRILLFVPEYLRAAMVFAGIAAVLVLPPIVAVFLARGLSVLGVRLYLKYGKPTLFDHAKFVRRIRTPVEFIFCMGAYFFMLIVLIVAGMPRC